MADSGKTGDWNAARRLMADLGKRANDAATKAVLQEAHVIRGQMVEGIDAQAPGGNRFAPLSPWTVAARRLAGFRGTKALVRTAFLRNSISVIQRAGVVFTGVARTARGKNGKALVDIARVQEFGAGPYVIQITPKMRRFLFVLRREMGLPPGNAGSSKGYITIKIPARPFIRPVWKKLGTPDQIRKRLEERMAKLLGGPFGR